MKSKQPLKWKFIRDYIKVNGAVDILNTDFVDAYIREFSPAHKVTWFGANKCADLSKQLSLMYHSNVLTRCSMSTEYYGMGFPKWIYVYGINGKI